MAFTADRRSGITVRRHRGAETPVKSHRAHIPALGAYVLLLLRWSCTPPAGVAQLAVVLHTAAGGAQRVAGTEEQVAGESNFMEPNG